MLSIRNNHVITLTKFDKCKLISLLLFTPKTNKNNYNDSSSCSNKFIMI